MVHTSTFMGLVNMSLDDELHALLLLSSLPISWETLVMSRRNSCQEEKLSLEVVKASLLNVETRGKEMGASSQAEGNVAQDSRRGRSNLRGSQNQDKFKGRSKFRGKLTPFYSGKPGHFQKNFQNFKRDKGNGDSTELRKTSKEQNTSAIATSEEELFISKQACVNLGSD